VRVGPVGPYKYDDATMAAVAPVPTTRYCFPGPDNQEHGYSRTLARSWLYIAKCVARHSSHSFLCCHFHFKLIQRYITDHEQPGVDRGAVSTSSRSAAKSSEPAGDSHTDRENEINVPPSTPVSFEIGVEDKLGEKQALERADGHVNTTSVGDEGITGVALLMVITGVTLVAFLMLLDTAIVSTVPFSLAIILLGGLTDHVIPGRPFRRLRTSSTPSKMSHGMVAHMRWQGI
jgi:hypothetical protein